MLNQSLRKRGTAAERERVLKEFLAKLDDQDVRVREAAAYLLLSQNPRTPHLLKTLLEWRHDPQQRDFALKSLKDFGPLAKEAIPDLKQQLKQSKMPVWNAVVLWKIDGSPDASLPIIQSALSNDDSHLRELAVSSLGHVGRDPEIVRPLLIRALSDKNQRVRFQAIESLARLGPGAKNAVMNLLPFLYDPDRQTRMAAVSALKTIRPSSEQAVLELRKLRDWESDQKASVAIDAAIAVVQTHRTRPTK